jgi:hypothetical protein
VSRTSTEGEARPRSDARFRRVFAITVTVLLLLVATFVALSYFQGPKLSSAQLDTARAVSQPGQQLRLFANQSIARVKASQVTITPATPFTVSTQGSVVAVQFGERLHYGTTYRVVIRGVSSVYQQRDDAFDYSFTTASASVYYLDRADPATGGEDRILRAGMKGAESRVVYSARHIQDFAAFPAALAVVTIDDDKTSSLSLVSIQSGVVEKLVLPSAGTVDKLQAAPDAGLLGFVFSSGDGGPSAKYSSTLMTVNLSGVHTVTPVLGLNSQPLSVLDWGFLSGSTSVVAQTFDQTVLLIDASKPGASVPLGQYSDLGRSSPDGKKLVVGDVFGKMAYTIATGKEKRMQPVAVNGVVPFGGDLELLGTGTDRVQQVAVFDSGTGRFTSYIVYEHAGTSRILYQSPDGKGSLDGFSVSPNGQYVAIEETPDVAASVSDGYVRDARSTSVTTIFVDIGTGAIVRSVAGFAANW